MRGVRIISIFWSILMAFLLIPSALSQGYYADIRIDINSDGKVGISGPTNHPALSSISDSDNFTAKDKKYWVINVSVEEVFSQYIAEINFPPKASLNYLKASDVLSIDNENGRITVAVTGKDEPLLFLAQYSFNNEGTDNSWLVWFLASVLVIFGIAVFYYFFKSKSKPKLRLESLTERQRKIVEIIQKNKGTTTQADLEKALKIPKASLSRNIDSLVMKNIIVKESKGMTNLIMLKPEKPEK